MASGKTPAGGRINSLNVPSFKSYSGTKTVSTADSANEKTLRGGSGTELHNTGKVAGGDFSPEGARNGYPTNK
jgi:hypothetical protein